MGARESSVEPTWNCSPASGGWLCADSVAAMQAAESQTVILYYSDLRGEWPQASSLGLHRALPYGKRLQVAARSEHSKSRSRHRFQHRARRSVGRLRGAAACVMTSCSVQQIEPCAVPLQELFAPWSVSSETSRA